MDDDNIDDGILFLSRTKAREIKNLNERLEYLKTVLDEMLMYEKKTFTEDITEENIHKYIKVKKPGIISITMPLSNLIVKEIKKTEDEILLQDIEERAREKDYQSGLFYLLDVLSVYNLNPDSNDLKPLELRELQHYDYNIFSTMIQDKIDQFKKEYLEVETRSIINGNRIKWIGKVSHLGYIMGLLAENGYIEVPKHKSGKAAGKVNYSQLAKQLSNIFEYEGCSIENLEKELNPEKNSMSETNKQEIFIPAQHGLT